MADQVELGGTAAGWLTAQSLVASSALVTFLRRLASGELGPLKGYGKDVSGFRRDPDSGVH